MLLVGEVPLHLRVPYIETVSKLLTYLNPIRYFANPSGITAIHTVLTSVFACGWHRFAGVPIIGSMLPTIQ